MRILVTWGSKAGGTAGIGRRIAEELGRSGFDVTARPVAEIKKLDGFDAAIIGGALYAGLWHGAARRFVSHHVKPLRRMPVWLFSSGPLDATADAEEPPPPEQVSLLSERVGALGHVTFGGRLLPDARGFPSAAMAKTRAGDWRNLDRVGAWAAGLAEQLPNARPGVAVDPPARSLMRLFGFGFGGWAMGAVLLAGLVLALDPSWVLPLHAVGTAAVYYMLARLYFGARGARPPLQVASVFVAIHGALNAAEIFGFLAAGFELVPALVDVLVSTGIVFATTYLTGQIGLMIPPVRPDRTASAAGTT